MAHESEIFNVLGVDYYVDWRRVSRGASFFIPTTATAAQVMSALRQTAKHLGVELVARQRREYGMYGVRVWRTH